MASALLDGFPPIADLRLYQGSMHKPGRLVVDTPVVGPSEISKLPRITNLTIYAQNFAGTWRDMRVVKSPRVRNGYMRTVLEDSRWKLRDCKLNGSHNLRNEVGGVLTSTSKTIAELVQEIAQASGLTITIDTVPTFLPPARWADESGYVAMERLLKVTGCRLVYNPITEAYNFTQCATGPMPGVSSRVFRPGPPPTIKSVTVRTSPVMYEDRMDCEAVEIDPTTGNITTLDPVHVPDGPAEEGKQTSLRLWRPTDVTLPVGADVDDIILLPYRAKCHMYDPEHMVRECGRIIRDDFERYPYHQTFVMPDSGGEVIWDIPWTSGGKVFVTDHPIMMTVGGGVLSAEAKLLTAYYAKDGEGNLIRKSHTVEVDASATNELTHTVSWIKPVESTESDIGADSWDDLLQDVAESLAQRHRGQHQTMTLASPIDLEGSGQVGAVAYKMNTRMMRAAITFQVAFNFDPSNAGALA